MRWVVPILMLMLAGCAGEPTEPTQDASPDDAEEPDTPEETAPEHTEAPDEPAQNTTAGNQTGPEPMGNATGNETAAGNATGNATIATAEFTTSCQMGGTWFYRLAAGGVQNPGTLSASTSCAPDAPTEVGYVGATLTVTGEGTGAISGAKFYLRDAAGTVLAVAETGDSLSGTGSGAIPEGADLSGLTVSLEEHLGGMYGSSIKADVLLVP